MATRHIWGKKEIVVLDGQETIQNQCEVGDAAVSYFNGEDDTEGWGVTFIGRNFELNGWDAPFDTVQDAVDQIQSMAALDD